MEGELVVVEIEDERRGGWGVEDEELCSWEVWGVVGFDGVDVDGAEVVYGVGEGVGFGLKEDGEVLVGGEGDEVGEAVVVEVGGGEVGEVGEVGLDSLLEVEMGDLVVGVGGVVVDVDVGVVGGGGELVLGEFGEGGGGC